MGKPKIAVLLSGCGVYDGTEIHESVLTFLALDQAGAEYQCVAPDIRQHHVINHINGEETNEKRNVLMESARIARGNIKSLNEVSADDFDGLAIPGGFGAAKNLTKWAISGPEGEIDPEVKRFINEFVMDNKPVAAMCMGPTVVAKALQGTGIGAKLTVGTTEEPSPYDIGGVSGGMEKIGAIAEMRSVSDFVVDDKNKIITTPCYMMEASISQINEGVSKVVKKLMELV